MVCSIYAADYPVTSYVSIDQGLSNNSVRCIYQDQKGFIWFGTYDGLNRYDGYSFKVFRNNYKYSNSLINNWINAIDEDRRGRVWVGTRQGLCIYNSFYDSFSNVYYKPAAQKTARLSANIKCIERDEQGNMFIGTSNGLYFCAGADPLAERVMVSGETGFKTAEVPAIKVGSDKTVWVFVNGIGLCVYDYAGKRLTPASSAVKGANCLETNGRYVLVGANDGIHRYDPAIGNFDALYNVKDITGLTADRQNKLWVATNGNGVNIIELASGKIENLRESPVRYSINSNTVTDILVDKDGRKWIGTLRGGINVIDPYKERFRSVMAEAMMPNTLVSNYVFCFHEEPNGHLWIGSDGGGISVWDRRQNKFTNYKHDPHSPTSLVDNFITGIQQDAGNDIWIATYRGGVNRYNKASGTFEQYRFLNGSHSEVSGRPTFAILNDRQNNCWVSTIAHGLFKLNRSTRNFELFDNTLTDLFVLKQDCKNILWGGNLSQLVQIDINNLNHHFFPVGKPVRALHEDTGGRLWIGTEGAGLLLFDRSSNKVMEQYTTDEGLCSNSVLNILEDDLGNLWMSTYNGISAFNIKTKSFRNYYQSDGLQSNQFNYNAALKLHTGEMVFGGIKGFTLFNPASMVTNKREPGILFTDIKVNNTPLGKQHSLVEKGEDDLDIIKVPFNKAIFSFEFSALEYSASDKIQYAYYLKGWDRGWNYIGNKRSALYTHLSEGSYLLSVKCTNSEGVWSKHELKLRIIVFPPWYRTWWAYGLYIVIISIVAYIFLQYRAKQTRLQYEVEREHAEREKERILNEKEREMTEKKISFVTNISHEFRTPLTLILNPIEDLLRKKQGEQLKPDNELSIIFRNAQRMRSLVDQLLLFQKAESGLETIQPSKLNLRDLAYEVYLCFVQQARSKNITYNFDCANTNLEVYADREKLEIILFNLLSNAIKYTSENGLITFVIHDKPEGIYTEIHDTGDGISAQAGDRLFEKFYKAPRLKTSSKAGFGIGLYLVKHFTELHKGSISYKSEEGKGTVFTLVLLKGRDHFTEVIDTDLPSAPMLLDELREEVLNTTESRAEEKATENIISANPTILIIDDDDEIRKYLVALFKDQFIIKQAENGDDGLTLAQKYLPDLIISDIHMPGLNGIELCKTIKQRETLCHIPVMLLTSSASEEIKLRGLEGGADDYITKPFDNAILKARVINIVNRKNALQKYFYNEITLLKDDVRIPAEYKEFIEKCIAVVESHLGEETFNVKTLSQEMGMSHSNIFRRVKLVSGQSVNVFIRYIRLRKAAEFFINTSYNVNETAQMVGINDVKYFREQFNKLFGMNPSEYIKKFRKVHGRQFTVDRESINPRTDNRG